MRVALDTTRLPTETREALEALVAALRAVPVTDLQGFTVGATRVLREDGTFAAGGLTQAQVLARVSFR